MAAATSLLMYGGLNRRASEPVAVEAPAWPALRIKRECDLSAATARALETGPFEVAIYLDNEEIAGMELRSNRVSINRASKEIKTEQVERTKRSC